MLKTQLDQSKAEGARVHTNQLDLVAQVAQLEREVKQKELEVAQRLAKQAAEAPRFPLQPVVAERGNKENPNISRDPLRSLQIGFSLEEEEGVAEVTPPSVISYLPSQAARPTFRVSAISKEATNGSEAVYAVGGRPATQYMPIHSDMVSMEVAKGVETPKFDPSDNQWDDFEADWQIHWEKISSGRQFSD